MGLYRTHVVPRIVRFCCGMTPAETRARVCAGLVGDVVELGFGSGLNVPHYPPSVRRVLAVEPSDVGYRMAGALVADAPVPVERIGLDGARLPLADGSVDSALSTWTLCRIPDVDAALSEVRRVLRPGGRLHFLESAGFRLERLENSYEKGPPKPMGYLYEGVAVA